MRAQGSIKERSPGVWQVRVYLGLDVEGKRTGRCETVRGAKRDARAKLAEFVKAKPERGVAAVAAYRATLGEWIDEYLKTWCRHKSDRTVRDLEYTLKHYPSRVLQATKLAAVTNTAIANWVISLTDERKLAPRTVAKALSELRECLGVAVRNGHLVRNPSDYVKPPKRAHVERACLTAEQASAFLAVAESHPLRALFTLAIFTGARPSELLALQWRDIGDGGLCIRRALVKDDAGKSVVADTKTGTTRVIPLGPVEREALRLHRLAFAKLHDTVPGVEAFIFASDRGTPLELRNVANRHFAPLLKEAGLPSLRLYDLRHSCLSILAAAGEDPKVIAERAGHTTIATTYKHYVHTRPDAQSRATETLTRLVGGGKA